MDSCCIKPKVRNKNGELVNSILFNDLLLHTLDNRPKAIEYYAIGKHPDFLSGVSSSAKFDLNGELTFNSFRKEAGIDISKELIIDTLNRQIGSGEYEFNEAISKASVFNNSHDMREDFLATISNSKEGKVKLEIVENTQSNRNNYIQSIKNRTLEDRLRALLAKHNVSVSFLDGKENGRYSTENIERTTDGFYNLIQIAHGQRGQNALAEETGHFIIGALGDNSLAQRLINSLTPENIKSIFGEDKYNEILKSKNPAREAAGLLIGQMLKKGVDLDFPINRMVKRLTNLAKVIFNRIKGNEVGALKANLEGIAYKIAYGATHDLLDMSVDNALSTKETLYSAPDSTIVLKYEKILLILQAQVLNAKEIDVKISRKFGTLFEYALRGYTKGLSGSGVMLDIVAYLGLVDILTVLPNELEMIIDKVANIDISYTGLDPVNAGILRSARLLVNNIELIRDLIDDLITPGYSVLEARDAQTLRRLSAVLNNILRGNGESAGFLSVLKLKEKDFYIKFLELLYGSKYVTHAARKLFKNFKLVSVNESRETIASMVEAQDDESWLYSTITSMNASLSFTNKIVDNTIRYLLKIANDKVLNVRLELTLLEDALKANKWKTEEFFERDLNGNLTGNIIQEYLYGVLDLEYLELYLNEKKKFYETVDKTGKTSALLAYMFAAHFAPIKNAFYNSHYTLSSDGRTRIPVDKYKNQYYINNIKGTDKEKWLKQYMALKNRIDVECYGKLANEYRAPQFKGTKCNRFRNRLNSMSKIKNLYFTYLHENFVESFVEDAEDREFGGMMNYESPDELFTDKDIFEQDKILRVPVFGVNKLKDMSTLSTDLFASTLAYASVSYKYKNSKSLANTLELGREVMRNTDYKRKITWFGKRDQINSFVRLEKFLDKELYSLKTYKITLRRLIVNKLVNAFSSMASKLFLGGNVAGGLVNVGTGSIEVFKEAFAGEHFTMANWAKANSIYFSLLPSNIIHAGSLIKYDKVSMFIDKFNVLDKLEENVSSYNTKKWWAWRVNPLGDNLFLPYKSGEHYMLTIPFIATALNTKLYDISTGKYTNLWDALVEVNENPIVTKKNGKPYHTRKRLELTKDYLLDAKYEDEYRILSSISAAVNSSSSSIATYSLEELDYMNNHGIDPNVAKEEILAKIRERIGEITFTPKSESDFINKCREINNRMHGIYNSLDKANIQQHIWMKAIFSMRNYAFGMITRRFGLNTYSISLGTDSEGSMITAAKVLTDAFTTKGQFMSMMKVLFLPFTKKAKQTMLDAGYSANQYANMRRNFADFIFIGLLEVIKMLTAKVAASGGDDDDDDDLLTGIIYYFASRLARELAAFNTPWGLHAEIPVLTNIEPAGLAALTDILLIGELAVLLAFGDEDAYYKRTGGTYKERDSKVINKVLRLLPFYRSWLLLLNPYKAAKSYEFGRANKAR